MTSQVSNFIPGSLENTYKYTEGANEQHITEKQKVKFE